MTGRDLIIYILANNLENEPVFKDGKFIGFVTVEEAAVKMGVGVATLRAWIDRGQVEAVLCPSEFYISDDAMDRFVEQVRKHHKRPLS